MVLLGRGFWVLRRDLLAASMQTSTVSDPNCPTSQWRLTPNRTHEERSLAAQLSPAWAPLTRGHPRGPVPHGGKEEVPGALGRCRLCGSGRGGGGVSLEGQLWLGPLIYKPGHRLEARTLTTTPRPMLGGPGRGLSPQWAQTPVLALSVWRLPRGSGGQGVSPFIPCSGCRATAALSSGWASGEQGQRGLSGGRVISHGRLFLWLQCHRYWTVATASSGE